MGTYYTVNDGVIVKKDADVIAKEREYIHYIMDHIKNVNLAFQQLFFSGNQYIPNGIEEEEYNNSINQLAKEISQHDMSKFNEEEFNPYRVYFYSTDKEKEEMDNDLDYAKEVYDNFMKAWELHYTRNDHHPMFWIVKENDNKVIKDMSLSAIIHMICDWCAMSYSKTQNFNPITWYNSKAEEEKASMSPKTKQLVDELLFLIFSEKAE